MTQDNAIVQRTPLGAISGWPLSAKVAPEPDMLRKLPKEQKKAPDLAAGGSAQSTDLELSD
jgi:hypothetical protein